MCAFSSETLSKICWVNDVGWDWAFGPWSSFSIRKKEQTHREVGGGGGTLGWGLLFLKSGWSRGWWWGGLKTALQTLYPDWHRHYWMKCIHSWGKFPPRVCLLHVVLLLLQGSGLRFIFLGAGEMHWRCQLLREPVGSQQGLWRHCLLWHPIFVVDVQNVIQSFLASVSLLGNRI